MHVAVVDLQRRSAHAAHQVASEGYAARVRGWASVRLPLSLVLVVSFGGLCSGCQLLRREEVEGQMRAISICCCGRAGTFRFRKLQQKYHLGCPQPFPQPRVVPSAGVFLAGNIRKWEDKFMPRLSLVVARKSTGPPRQRRQFYTSWGAGCLSAVVAAAVPPNVCFKAKQTRVAEQGEVNHAGLPCRCLWGKVRGLLPAFPECALLYR